jgi:hypothetical protein
MQQGSIVVVIIIHNIRGHLHHQVLVLALDIHQKQFFPLLLCLGYGGTQVAPLSLKLSLELSTPGVTYSYVLTVTTLIKGLLAWWQQQPDVSSQFSKTVIICVANSRHLMTALYKAVT